MHHWRLYLGLGMIFVFDGIFALSIIYYIATPSVAAQLWFTFSFAGYGLICLGLSLMFLSYMFYNKVSQKRY